MGSEELAMNYLLLFSLFRFFIVDGKSVNATDKVEKTDEEKETEEGKNKVNPGYADDLAAPCIEDNEENNKYLKSVQPDVDKYFPMSMNGNGGVNVLVMNETESKKYTEEMKKFSETFQKELKNRVIKDGKKCIKLNFKWSFMIDSILNTELPTIDDLGEKNETDVVEEKEATEGKKKRKKKGKRKRKKRRKRRQQG